MNDKIFVGRCYDEKFCITKLNLTQADLDLLTKHLRNDKVNVKIKKSKGGKVYAEIDTYNQQPAPAQKEQPKSNYKDYNANHDNFNNDETDDLPF
jgi:hypothetical protein